eukprot:2769320-Ditylum_brightwellii.AAC.1
MQDVADRCMTKCAFTEAGAVYRMKQDSNTTGSVSASTYDLVICTFWEPTETETQSSSKVARIT